MTKNATVKPKPTRTQSKQTAKPHLIPAIIVTSPHLEQELRPCEAGDDGPIANRLYELSDTSDRGLAMTGEELTSLSLRWLSYLLGQKQL
jgi:hypothetical protein